MVLSDVSIKRPVLAAVFSLVLIIFGIISFDRLPLRQYPDIDPPVVSIDTRYPGAAANVIESRITELIEERIAGVEGIRFIESSSIDGRSQITIQFNVDRDIDAAANDIRDRINGVLDNLPDEADPPEVEKQDSNDDVIMWLNLTGENMSVPELTDYADRYLVDRFSVLNGVSRVRIGGQELYAMRIWLDRDALAARNLSVVDIENALRAENIELPAGIIESDSRQFTVRTKRSFESAEQFSNLVVANARNDDEPYLIRLRDVARVEKGTVDNRTFFRGNQVPMVGIGIIKQSTANIIEVANQAKAERDRVNANLPEGMLLEQSYDSSVFIRGAIAEVYKTLAIAVVLVVIAIFVFLASVRASLIPAVTVPVSVIATSMALLYFGFSINLLTLLAIVLAIGLVVDDSIVVLENIARRIENLKEPPLLAAYRGTRQVGFAVVATTVVLVSVFVPIAFQKGDVGRLFSEFALTMAAAVIFSSFVALTLTPMLASKFLSKNKHSSKLSHTVDKQFDRLQGGYDKALKFSVRHPIIVCLVYFLVFAAAVFAIKKLPQAFAPNEDRGAFFIFVNGPEGATFSYMDAYMEEIETRLMPYVESGEFTRLLVRAPRSFGRTQTFNSGIVIVVLDDWAERRNGFVILNEVRQKLADLPGVSAFPVMRQGFGGRPSKPVQFVIGGGTYEQLTQWRDTLVDAINKNNPGLLGLDWDYKETKPQLEVDINYVRASELGVKVGDIGRTLETLLGSKTVTTYIDSGEEYDVMLEGERVDQRTITQLQSIYVRSTISGELIPISNFVTINEYADSNSLNRYNRIRAITLEANLADGYSLGEALDYLENLTRETLPSEVIIDYKGQSQDLKFAGGSIIFIFALGIFVTYLALAAQFESWIHPLVIVLSVPLAMFGGLMGLLFNDGSLNLYSQIGLIMLVGLAAKNGILIVEFTNQLRDDGVGFEEAIYEAARVRLRPILMTGVTTIAGSVPLLLSSGAGSETRAEIGIVVFSGVISAVALTLFVIPVAYHLLARKTGSPNDTTKALEALAAENKDAEKDRAAPPV